MYALRTTLCRHLRGLQFTFILPPSTTQSRHPRENGVTQRFAEGPPKIETAGARPGENLAKFRIGGHSPASRVLKGHDFSRAAKAPQNTFGVQPPRDVSKRSFRVGDNSGSQSKKALHLRLGSAFQLDRSDTAVEAHAPFAPLAASLLQRGLLSRFLDVCLTLYLLNKTRCGLTVVFRGQRIKFIENHHGTRERSQVGVAVLEAAGRPL